VKEKKEKNEKNQLSYQRVLGKNTFSQNLTNLGESEDLSNTMDK